MREAKMTEEELRSHLSAFKGQLSIDPDDLEQECIRQPLLFSEIGELASQARSDAKRAKEHVEFIKARLKGEMRSNPQTYGLEKVTDKSLEAAVQAHDDTQDAIREHIEANRAADSLTILQTAAEQRRAMLKNLVELIVHHYFNSGDISEMKGRRSEQNVEAIVELRNRHRRQRDMDDVEVVRED
jgi:cysteinyl-tRNA synthetase